RAPRSALFPYTTLFRSLAGVLGGAAGARRFRVSPRPRVATPPVGGPAAAVRVPAAHVPGGRPVGGRRAGRHSVALAEAAPPGPRSEEHTSELQSRENLV